MNRTRLLEMTRVLDCIELIRENKDLLSPSERKITNPLDTARILLRKRIKDKFPAFYIRKNLTEYSLRCDDQELYRVLFFSKYIASNNQVLAKLSDDLSEHLRAKFIDINTVLFNSRRSNNIGYNFKNEGRLFIYISFVPQTEYINRVPSITDFKENSLSKRIADFDRLSLSIKELEVDEIVNKMMLLTEENPAYAIYNLNDEVTMDFINFYCNFEPSEHPSFLYDSRRGRIADIQRIYMRTLEAPLLEVVEQVDTSEMERRIDSIREDLEILTRPIEEENNRRIVFNESIARQAINLESAGAVVANEQAQNIFERALQRVVGQNIDEVEEEMNFELTLPTPMAASEPIVRGRDLSEEDTFLDPDYGPVITDESFNLYLRYFLSSGVGDPLVKTTGNDLYDDMDQEKDGLYFTVENGKIAYVLFKDNETLLQTTDINVARAKFEEVFSIKSSDIKYFNDATTKTLQDFKSGITDEDLRAADYYNDDMIFGFDADDVDEEYTPF